MTASNLIGKKLEEYHILSQLGEGGMSTIYLGLDTSLQRYTAIKVIHASLQSDPDNVARFKREAQAVARLDHPNIVRVYRYGQVEDILYMAMQYIEGLDLRVVLQNYRQKNELISPADAVRIVKEVCQALDYAHANGVLHRDVKPSNIMLNREGKAILTDFGLALLPEVDTQGKAFGTPQYMAPEQAQSPTEVGPQADLYAVGMLMYEMFTGDIPFHEIENPMEMVAKRVNTPPPPPSAIQPDLNSELEVVILKALALKPADRYESGQALAAALEQSLPNIETGAEQAAAEIVTVAPPAIIEEPETVESSAPLAAESEIIPQTVVPIPEPTQQIDRAPASSGKRFANLPVPPVFLGGCAVLALLAILLVGGVQFVRSQLQKYSTWMPLTIDGEGQNNAEGYPNSEQSETPDLGSAEGSASENEQQNSLLLQIATNKEDSFYLINVGNAAVPPSGLSFADDKNSFAATEWGVASLGPNECVSIWKDRGNPSAPDVSCNEIGNRIEREPNQIFWKKTFNVIYQEVLVTACASSGCEFFLSP